MITLVSAESGHVYRDADLELARELARHAALAVDNARLYEEARGEIAERRRAEEALRSSRNELEIVLQGALPTGSQRRTLPDDWCTRTRLRPGSSDIPRRKP